MKRRVAFAGIVAVVGLSISADLTACGEKFLVVGRGTRYQRPKNARAASILIYANPSSGLPAALKGLPMEPALKREGHRATTVQTAEQLSAILASGHFDVVLAGSEDTSAVEKLLGRTPDAPIVLTVCSKAGGREAKRVEKSASCALMAPSKADSLLEAIDKAVDRHDRNVRKAQTSA